VKSKERWDPKYRETTISIPVEAKTHPNNKYWKINEERKERMSQISKRNKEIK